MHKVKATHCPCGEPVFKTQYGRIWIPRYCSAACRQRAYRERVARSNAETLAEETENA